LPAADVLPADRATAGLPAGAFLAVVLLAGAFLAAATGLAALTVFVAPPDFAAVTALVAEGRAEAEAAAGLTADRTVTGLAAAEPAAAVRLAAAARPPAAEDLATEDLATEDLAAEDLAAGDAATGDAAAEDAAARAVRAPVVAARVGAFLGTAMGKFLLANDCGLVSAWRLQDSGLDTGVEPA
jgi:hypothetical protein